MFGFPIEDAIYLELLAVALALLAILLINTVELYQLKFNDPVCIMLILACVVCVTEFMWAYCDANPGHVALSYLSAGMYTVCYVLSAACFNYYFLDNTGLLPKSKKTRVLIYYVPGFIMLILCATTPWTHWVFSVSKDGYIVEEFLMDWGFMTILRIYYFFSLIPAIPLAFIKRKEKPELARVGRSLLVFSLIMLGNYLMQNLIASRTRDDYLSMSIVLALSLAYLITTLNTHQLVHSREKVASVAADMSVAARIQADVLPTAPPDIIRNTNILLEAIMAPAKDVGGDFYDYFAIDEKRICFLIADVSGKGVPAALFMMKAKTMIKENAMTHDDAGEIFTAANKQLCENNDAKMFATAWIGILDTKTLELKYTNAGLNYPLFKRNDEESSFLKGPHGPFLAGREDIEYSSATMQLKEGDCLLLYTDGVAEAHGATKEMYGTKRLKAAFDEKTDESETSILKNILGSIEEFRHGGPQTDDMTMLILKIR